MRPLIELLELVKEELNSPNYYTGLCKTIREMYVKDQISMEEQEKLHFCFMENRPPSYTTFAPYYFPRGERIPRIKFIDRIINSIKTNSNKVNI